MYILHITTPSVFVIEDDLSGFYVDNLDLKINYATALHYEASFPHVLKGLLVPNKYCCPGSCPDDVFSQQ